MIIKTGQGFDEPEPCLFSQPKKFHFPLELFGYSIYNAEDELISVRYCDGI